MVEVRQVDTHTDGRSRQTDSRRLHEAHHLLLPDGIHQPGDHHEEDDKQIVIGHLHVVGVDLKGRKHRREQQSPQIFAPISQHDTRNHWGQISQCPHLPDVACSNDNQEIGRESPDDTTQGRQMLSEVEGTQQDVEAQQVGKHIPHVLWQPQMIGIHSFRQHIRRAVRGCHLISGHTTKQGIRPTAALTRLLQVLYTFLSCSPAC